MKKIKAHCGIGFARIVEEGGKYERSIIPGKADRQRGLD